MCLCLCRLRPSLQCNISDVYNINAFIVSVTSLLDLCLSLSVDHRPRTTFLIQPCFHLIPVGIAEFAGLEFAGLENDALQHDGLESDGQEND